MLICHCALPYVNPNACKTCQRFIEDQNRMEAYDFNKPSTTVPYEPPKVERIKRTTRTIKKYDKKGKFKGEDIEITDVEIIERQVMPNHIFKYSDNTGKDPMPNTFTTSSDEQGRAYCQTSTAENLCDK